MTECFDAKTRPPDGGAALHQASGCIHERVTEWETRPSPSRPKSALELTVIPSAIKAPKSWGHASTRHRLARSARLPWQEDLGPSTGSAAAGEHVAKIAAAVRPCNEGSLRAPAEILAGPEATTVAATRRMTTVFARHVSSLSPSSGAVEFLAIDFKASSRKGPSRRPLRVVPQAARADGGRRAGVLGGRRAAVEHRRVNHGIPLVPSEVVVRALQQPSQRRGLLALDVAALRKTVRLGLQNATIEVVDDLQD